LALREAPGHAVEESLFDVEDEATPATLQARVRSFWTGNFLVADDSFAMQNRILTRRSTFVDVRPAGSRTMVDEYEQTL
jgi:hypothetical protein